MVVLYVSLAVAAVCGLVRWWLYLRWCNVVLSRTPEDKVPEHAVALARAYRELALKLPGKGG